MDEDQQRRRELEGAIDDIERALDTVSFYLADRNRKAREVAIARTHLETGVLWLREAAK